MLGNYEEKVSFRKRSIFSQMFSQKPFFSSKKLKMFYRSVGVIGFVMVTDCMPFRENQPNAKIVESQRFVLSVLLKASKTESTGFHPTPLLSQLALTKKWSIKTCSHLTKIEISIPTACCCQSLLNNFLV